MPYAKLINRLYELSRVGTDEIYWSPNLDLAWFEQAVREAIGNKSIEVVEDRDDFTADDWKDVLSRVSDPAGGCILIKTQREEDERLVSKYIREGVIHLIREKDTGQFKKTYVLIAAKVKTSISQIDDYLFYLCQVVPL
jgi:hypothetical protein